MKDLVTFALAGTLLVLVFLLGIVATLAFWGLVFTALAWTAPETATALRTAAGLGSLGYGQIGAGFGLIMMLFVRVSRNEKVR